MSVTIEDTETTDIGVPLELAGKLVLSQENGHHNQTNENNGISVQSTPAQSPNDPDRLLPEVVSNSNDDPSTPPSPPGDQEQYFYGCGPFHPKWIQLFANKKFFTVLMCLFTLIQGAVVSGISVVNISTLEKRYSFSSVLAGLRAVVYDVTILIGIIFISYFGGKSHKPRFLGISLIILGVGNLITASPQFLFGSFNDNTDVNIYEGCAADGVQEDEDCVPTDIGAFVILMIGQVVVGIGSSAVYTVAIAYIDEIVYPKYVSLHLGAMSLFAVIGPGIGFLLGSYLLSIYVDPWKDTTLTPDDPGWIGAWWIAPIIMAVLSFVGSVFFLMFPKWLPDSHLVTIERVKEMAKTYSSDYVNENSVSLVVKQFPVQIKHLLMNASFMTASLALSMIFIIREGVITFGPKYMESMYGLTPTAAGLISGGTGIVGAALGVTAGALAVYFWNPVGRKTTIIPTIILLICIPFVLVFLFKCPTTNVAGVNVSYNDGTYNGSACTMNCSCQSSVYEPVCGDDGVTYFSPCRAGCRTVYNETQNLYSFENCSCIGSLSAQLFNVSNGSSAVEGVCPQTDVNCSYQLVFFMIMVFLLVFMLVSLDVPFYHYTLRVVADDQRHLALGLQSAIYRLFGSIPGPLLFGAVIDLACVEWDYNCGIRGNCWIYDNDRLSSNAIALCLPFAILSLILLVVAMVTYPKKKTDEDDNKEDDQKKNKQ